MMHYKHHSPAVRLLCKASWLLTSVGALAVGLTALGNSMGKNWNLWEQDFMVNNFQWAIQPLQYLIGIAGLVSLISFFMCLGHKHDDGKR